MAYEIDIRASDRLCLFGRTGSGKTTLARKLLSKAATRVAVLDAKHTYRQAGFKVVAEHNDKLPREIIRVPPDGPEALLWNETINEIWQDGRRLIYVDETTLITPARVVLPALGKAIRTGRELGIGVWCASQRPKEIPSVIFTEAEHFFTFQLTFQADRRKVREFTSDDYGDAIESLTGHDYAYYDVRQNRVLVVRVRTRRR